LGHRFVVAVEPYFLSAAEMVDQRKAVFGLLKHKDYKMRWQQSAVHQVFQSHEMLVNEVHGLNGSFDEYFFPEEID